MGVIKSLAEKYKRLFRVTEDKDLIPNPHIDTPGEGGNFEEEDVEQGELLKLIYENRQRLARVDERTAFITKITFGVFISLIVGIGAGIAVALA